MGRHGGALSGVRPDDLAAIAVREAVARGLGVGTVSQSEYVPDPRLRPVRIEGNVVWTHIQVCCLRERRDSMLIASFFDAVERCRVRSQ